MSKTIGLEKIARRYSEALFALAKSDEEKTLEELASIKEVFEANDDLYLFLGHPSIDGKAKQNLLISLFENKVSDNVFSLIMILEEKNRLNLVPMLHTYFKEEFLKKRNIEVAKVSSAKALSDEQLAEIKTKLETIFGKALELETNIDETLIAGVKVNVGEKVLDSSIKSKLRQMKQLLTA